jgi:DNA invertase Pin-like site-specific DNA recombinase
MLGIYCRISREKEEGKNVSIPDQKKKGIAKAKELGLKYDFYIDEGVSGTLPINQRPEFFRLIEDITEGKITHLFAVDQSRIERSPETRSIVNAKLKEKGVRLFTEMEGEVDFTDPQQTMMGDVMSAFNKFFVDITTKKIKSALLHRVEEGKAHQGMQPYGYTKDEQGYLIIDKEESKIIKKIYQLSLEGKGQKSIVEWLNDHKILTRYAKIGKGTLTTKNKYTGEKTITDKKNVKWASRTVHGIIKNPIYKGERLYKGKVYNAPAILEKEYWQKVNDNLQNNRTSSSGNKPKYDYLLKGLLRCEVCNRNYYGRTRENKKDHYYMCSSKRYKGQSCGNRSVNIDSMENFIWFQIFYDKERIVEIHKAFLGKLATSDRSDLEVEQQMIEGKLRAYKIRQERATELLLDGTLDKQVYTLQNGKITKEIEEQEKRLKEINSRIKGMEVNKEEILTLLAYIEQVTEKSTFEQKRLVVKKVLKNIKIYYSDKHETYLFTLQYHSGVEEPFSLSRKNFEKFGFVPSVVTWEKGGSNSGGNGETGIHLNKSKPLKSNNTGTTGFSKWVTSNTASDVALLDVTNKMKELLDS